MKNNTQQGGTNCINNVSIYIDGVSQSIVQWDQGIGDSGNSASPLYFGSSYSGYSVSGDLDETRIYTRALSSTEVVDLMNVTGPGSVKFNRTGSPDIPCAGFIRSSYTNLTSGVCNTTGYQGGSWDVSVTNPNGYTGILPNGFNLTIASANPLRFFAHLFRFVWGSFFGNENALAAFESTSPIFSPSKPSKPLRLTKISTFIPPQLNLNTATLPWDSLSNPRLNKSAATLPFLIETIEQ